MTGLGCVSVAGCQAPLALLERLAYGRAEPAARLPGLRAAAGARGLVVLSTCQRVELYGSWDADPDPEALLTALAADRGVPAAVVRAAATTYAGDAAARHLLRVATGMESFVLGETEIAGQVRHAAEAGRAAGADAALERLLATAVSAGRRAHRHTGIAASSRSVAAVALDAVAAEHGGTLAGERLLVVGAGEVAAVVVTRGAALGAHVTVCNRTRRHAARFAAAGATVVDLAALPDGLATADIAITATAAPHPLVDTDLLRRCRPHGRPLTLVDLALPRNVAASVRDLDSVRLIDLADLRADGTTSATAAAALTAEIAAVEAVIEAELARYRRWEAGRGAGPALRRMRADAEEVARQEIARAAVPPEVRPALERAVLRTVHRLAHATTRELLAAAQAGDDALVARLGSLYGPSVPDDAHAAAGLGDPFLGRPPLDPQRPQLRPLQQAPDQRGVHPADELAV
ncbi:MAG TPA: glutamyl-tRNA reductase [Mycobacteriales bacterium]|nr:glutamyl-tRNA reductase [Mycobacteriales bacterium]